MNQKDWITILRNMLLILILVISWKLLKMFFYYLRNHAFFKPTSMEPNKCNQLFFYMSGLRNLYKQRRPKFPLLSVLMQGLLGLCCETFDKERIFRLYLLFQPGFLLYKPETVQAVLSSSTLTDKSSQYKVFHSWLGTGLLTRIQEAAINRVYRPWLYLDIIYNMTPEGKKYSLNLKRVHGFTRKVIKEKTAEMLEQRTLKKEKEITLDTEYDEGKRKAFLEFLLEYHFNDSSFTEENIREEVDTFMFAGYETTGLGLSWILYCIGYYPEVQKKIVEELDGIFQKDTERDVTREDLAQMKYLECTIKETFRLYPPAPFFMRECNEIIEILGHTIYPGSFFFVFPYALHRDRESFPEPEKFIPERFIPENSRGRHPYAYIPFSAGPRNCIGQKFAMAELKTMVANVLRSLRVTSLDPRDKVTVVPNMTLTNTEPLRLRFDIR